MVRFSDMLGGSGEPEDDDATTESPYAALADEPEPDDDATDDDDDERKEPVPVSTFETPEAVLSRLTQYATSARANDQTPPPPVEITTIEMAAPEMPVVEPPAEPEPDPEPEVDEPPPPVGDDFLPNVRGIARRVGRGRKRHP